LWSAISTLLSSTTTTSSAPARGAALHSARTSTGGPSTEEVPTDFRARLALNDSEPQFELIQPLSGPGAHQEWLDTHGPGFHHVGIIVDSVATTTAEMNAAGYDTVMAGEGFGADGDGAYAYFDTTADLGFVIEAVEPPRAMPQPDFVWPRQ